MPESALLRSLTPTLGAQIAQTVAQTLTHAGTAEIVQDLLEELQATSGKIAHAAIEAIPDLLRRSEAATIAPWLDVGIALAGTSGALALKYVKESPLILGILDSAPIRQKALALILELADAPSDHASHCAFEFFRTLPELLHTIPLEELHHWANIGMDLVDADFILGIEFFKESPAIAQVLSLDQVRPWVKFGTKLIIQNSLGKPDYVGTLEFFRSSPAILREVPEPELRTKVIGIGSLIADRFPREAVEFLADAPQLLHKLPSPAWRLRILQYAELLADRDGEVTLSFIRRSPEFLSLAGEEEKTTAAFQKWFGGGMDILAYSPEGARAYFALETRKALSSLEQALSGVFLTQVLRSLTLFGQMICGQPVAIEPVSTQPTVTDPVSTKASPPSNPSEKGGLGLKQTIYLPDKVNTYSTREDNLRLYTVMTAHELGHLEFGTYRIQRATLQQLILQARTRYGIPEAVDPPPPSLSTLFDCYPQPGVIRDLWMILEDARVEHHLQVEYPGLRQDLKILTQDNVKTRSFVHGMTAREMVLDTLLLLLSAMDPKSVPIRDDLRSVVEPSWQEAQGVQQTGRTADEVLPVADRIYQLLDEMIGNLPIHNPSPSQDSSDDASTDIGAGPRAAEKTGSEYRPVTNLAYRGTMDPDWVECSEHEQSIEEPQIQERPPLTPDTEAHDSGQEDQETSKESPEPSLSDHHLSKTLPITASRGGTTAETPTEWLYDEWDHTIQDYRTKWCRVVEQPGVQGSGSFVQTTLTARAPAIRLLRRYFESIRPTALRRIYGQEDGEEVDWDALIQRIVNRRVGHEVSDRVYVRRDRRERQVAVAFLIDMSGSTGRQLDTGQRVIDIEKESLVVMSEALEAIGDTYAIYGYSGRGRGQVDFIVLKQFDDGQTFQAGQRIEAVTPLQQNRDGAAIRHTVQKLLGCPARHRLCVLLSDGKPLDTGYADDYALEDTKMALREARQKGVRPFCLTVDRHASEYLKRMYGEVGYIILDDIMALPERLPKIYHNLTA